MTGKEARQKLSILIQEIEAQKVELNQIVVTARQSNDQLVNVINEINNKLNVVNTAENNIAQKSQSADQSLSVIVEKKGNIEKEVESIIILRSEIEKKKLEIEQFANQTDELLEKNLQQSEKISELLQKAAAGSLFKSFDVRKKEHEKSVSFWVKMLGGSAIALFFIAFWFVWMAHTMGVLSYEFLIKLSISFPVIFWLAFSSNQYSKAKRLEEEYAFKSAISLSLEAYRDMIKKESSEPTKTEVIPFITGAINQIFSSPTITISDHPEKNDGVEIGLLKEISDIFKKFTK